MIDMGPFRTQEPWHAKKDPCGALVALMREQFDRQSSRYALMRRYATVYEYGWRAAERLTTKQVFTDESVLTFNIAANAIDTVLSQTCAARILPVCSTEGGTYDEQQLAEEASRALEGLFEEVEFDRLFEDMARDAEAMSGTGFLKVYPDFEACKVRVERVPPLDIVIDEAETRYGEPRCFYQRTVMDRFVAAEVFSATGQDLEGSAKARRDACLSAPPAAAGEDFDQDDALIEVYEGWCRPACEAEEDEESEGDGYGEEKPKAKKSYGGRHALCVEKMTLSVDDEGAFPFIWYTPKRPRIGFWGIPLMRQLAPAQREAEVMVEKIQRAHKKLGGAHFLVPKSANLSVRKLGNGIGDALEYEGQMAPHEWTPSPVHPQTYQYFEQLANNALRFAGIPQMNARGEKPAGLNSGKAILAYADETSRYMGDRFRERERVVKRATELMLDAIEDLVERKPGLTARLRDGSGYRTIPWKRILDIRHKLVFKCTPINALTQNWIGKQQTIDGWFNAGAIDGNTWRKLGDIPDLAAQNAKDMAPGDLIESQLARMVRTGEYSSPEPFYPLETAKTTASNFYCMAAEQGVSDARLKLVRDFIADCDRMQQDEKAKAAAAAAGQAPPGDAMGASGAPPGAEAMPPDMGAPPPDMGGMPPGMMPPDMGGAPPMM